MRSSWLTYSDAHGDTHLITASLDTDFVASAYLEHGACARWHFGYSRREQDAIAELIQGDDSLRRAILVTWYDAVDPYQEGHHPGVRLDMILAGGASWARFSTGEHAEQRPVELLTVQENDSAPSPIRLGRQIYAAAPFISAERMRAAGAEYIRTGRLPASVPWQRWQSLVPVGPFGRQIVADEDLPPVLNAPPYPRQAQPWVDAC